MDKRDELLKRYFPLGTPEQIEEALTKAEELFAKYKRLGSPVL